MDTLANINRIYRRKKSQLNLTQKKLAALLNITQPAVSQYLNGVIPLNTDIILQFARILQVNPSILEPSLQNAFLLGKTKRPIKMINEGTALTLFASENALGFRIPDNTYQPRYLKGDVIVFTPIEPNQLSIGTLIILYKEHEYYLGRITEPYTLTTKHQQIHLPHKNFHCGLIESIVPDTLEGDFE